jgi:hypothetical protein
VTEQCERCGDLEADAMLGGRALCWDCYDEVFDDMDGRDEDEICDYCGEFIDEYGDCDCEKEM